MYLPFRNLCKLMVLLLHWFIPYKVERGNTYFQCGTKEFKPKTMQGNQAKRAKGKGKEFLSTYSKINKVSFENAKSIYFRMLVL